MSSAEDDGGIGFAPPPFNAQAALQQLQRGLRDLKLAERHGGFDLRGKRVAELRVADSVLHARLARKLALTPEFDVSQIKTAAEQRKWLDDLKKRLARWDTED